MMVDAPPDILFAVTGSQRPYIYDLPQLLSLPLGFEFRFRYRHKWIDQSLWPVIARNPSSFTGKPLIILFHSQERRRILPMRHAKIIRLEELGPLVYVRFTLGPFVKNQLNVRDLAALGSAELKEQSRLWQVAADSIMGYDAAATSPTSSDQAGRDLSQPLPGGSYLRAAKSSTDVEWVGRSTQDTVDAWGGLATVLQEEEQLKGVPLFYVLGFEDESQSLLQPVAVRNRLHPRRPNIMGFRLVEKDRYRLRLLTWNGSYPRAAEMKVNTHFDPAVLSLEGASDLVVGRYDVLDFTFLGNKSGYTELGISAEPVESKVREEASSTESWKTWPAIYLARIPVKVRLNWLRVTGVGLLATAGLALYLGAPTLAQIAGGRLKPFIAGLQALGLLITFICVSGITEKLIKVREHVIKLGEKPKLPTP